MNEYIHKLCQQGNINRACIWQARQLRLLRVSGHERNMLMNTFLRELDAFAADYIEQVHALSSI